MKHSREKRKSKTEKAVRKGLRDVFDMPLTDVGRLAIDRNCFHCEVKDAMSSGDKKSKQYFEYDKTIFLIK